MFQIKKIAKIRKYKMLFGRKQMIVTKNDIRKN